jgi:hypothetical protein
MFPFLEFLSMLNPAGTAGMANGMATDPDTWGPLMDQLVPGGPNAMGGFSPEQMAILQGQGTDVGQALLAGSGGADPRAGPAARTPLPGMMSLGGPQPGPEGLGMGESVPPEFASGPTPEQLAAAGGASMGVVDPMNPTVGAAGQPEGSFAPPVVQQGIGAPGAPMANPNQVVPPALKAGGGAGAQPKAPIGGDTKPIFPPMGVTKPELPGLSKEKLMLISALMGSRGLGGSGAKIGPLGSYV